MALDPPKPGEVIRYSYLWWSEARQGREEGLKDRPAAVVLTRRTEDKDTIVYVLPITHTPPHESEYGIEIPAATKRRLGLDDERSWIITTELNKFVWPGYDVRRTQSGERSYGLLPEKLIRELMESVRERARSKTIKSVDRDTE